MSLTIIYADVLEVLALKCLHFNMSVFCTDVGSEMFFAWGASSVVNMVLKCLNFSTGGIIYGFPMIRVLKWLNFFTGASSTLLMVLERLILYTAGVFNAAYGLAMFKFLSQRASSVMFMVLKWLVFT